MTTISSNTHLACDFTVFTSEYRKAHEALAIKLRNSVIGIEHLDEGFNVYFQQHANPDQILAFALDEQRCCGFLKGAEVYRETVNHHDRIVLSFKTGPEGAFAWIGAFFVLGQPSIADDKKENAQTHSNKWIWPAAIAGIMCMACILPIIGAMLVARGLMPSHWNIGEAFYLLFGGATVGLWLVVKRMQAANKNPPKGGCGC